MAIDEAVTAIVEARARLIEFVEACGEDEWTACPLGEGDPRPVAVIADHVAHAYEYISGMISELVAERDPGVTAETIDGLNAEHAAATGAALAAGELTTAGVAGRLTRSGDALVAMLAALAPEQLEIERVARLATIAARHADNHRSEVQEALAGAVAGPGED
jgi:hypothetical protein